MKQLHGLHVLVQPQASLSAMFVAKVIPRIMQTRSTKRRVLAAFVVVAAYCSMTTATERGGSYRLREVEHVRLTLIDVPRYGGNRPSLISLEVRYGHQHFVSSQEMTRVVGTYHCQKHHPRLCLLGTRFALNR